MSTVKLNLGSGKDWRKDCINADIQPEKKPDWVLDITKVPWGDVIDTRLGRFAVEKGMVTEIIANDGLEHIPDPVPYTHLPLPTNFRVLRCVCSVVLS